MKYVFVDMDGVIAEYGYPSGSYDGDYQKGNYVGKKPVGAIIDEIIRKYNNKNYVVMVCSASPNAKATIEKNDWLNNNFGVPYENRIFITLEEDKVEIIRYYIEDIMHGNVQEHAIIIDDKGSVLAKAHSLGMECYHPSQLLALKKYEEDKAKLEAQEAEQQRQAEMEQQQTEQEYTPEDTAYPQEENVEMEIPDNIEGQMSVDDLQSVIDEQNNVIEG